MPLIQPASVFVRDHSEMKVGRRAGKVARVSVLKIWAKQIMVSIVRFDVLQNISENAKLRIFVEKHWDRHPDPVE